ncbi:MAG: MGMT family protein [Fidelibacterota bacterium]
MTPLYQRIYSVVRQIPYGRVTTYGHIANLVHTGPRQVGYAMAAVRDVTIPWHRVINSQGKISVRSGGSPSLDQRMLLESEGVIFDAAGKTDLKRFGWFPVIDINMEKEK